MEIMTQRVELLSVAPGESATGQPTVILTIRPEPTKNFRPHNIALSRPQAIRLLRSLRTVLRQSASVLLFGLALGCMTGCSTEVKVVAEKTTPGANGETAPVATHERTTTDVAVRLLDENPSPVEGKAPVTPAAAAPPPDPKTAAEIIGDGNTVVVVEGDLHQHRHLHFHEAPVAEHVEIEIRRYNPERDERCERLRQEYEAKVRQLRRMFYD